MIVACVPDLMDRSRIEAVAGRSVVFVSSPANLAEAVAGTDVRLAIVDLSRAGVLDALRAVGGRVHTVGFGSHVEAELLEEASRAGCDEVLPRSVFFRRLPELVSCSDS